MRLMIDTNIFLDVLMQRELFYEHSKAVLRLCENKKVQGFLSASSVTDIFYTHERIHSPPESTVYARALEKRIVFLLNVFARGYI